MSNNKNKISKNNSNHSRRKDYISSLSMTRANSPYLDNKNHKHTIPTTTAQ